MQNTFNMCTPGVKDYIKKRKKEKENALRD